MTRKVAKVTTGLAVSAASGEQFLTCKEAAAIVKLSEISIRRLLTKGKLRRFKMGARTLISRAELLGLVRVSE